MPTPITEQDYPVAYEIHINGTALSNEVEVLSIGVALEVNRIATATLKISDGGIFGLDNEPFSNSESGNFLPGNEIEIQLGYGDETNLVFKGVIVGQRMTARSDTSYLVVTCKDKSFTLTKSRGNDLMDKSKDDDLFSQLVEDAGLQASVVSATQFPYPLVRFNASAWDYLVIRAEANNFFVLTDQNKVSVKDYDFSASPSCSIDAGTSVIEVELELSGENTYSEYNFSSWDPSTQAVTSASGSMDDTLGLGNLTSKQIAGDLSLPTLKKFTSASVSADELTAYSKSWVSKSALSKIQGKIVVPGFAGVRAGDLVQLGGFGTRFDGNAFVSKVEHSCKAGSWNSTLYVGMQSRWHASLPDVQEEEGMGLLPGVKGIHLAKVKKLDEDPASEFRVQIELATYLTANGSADIWARLGVNYASNQAGFFFFPEVGDEVLVTFMNGDPRFPVIIGSLYSSQMMPKLTPDAENSTKAIHTKSGIAVVFNDKDKILTLETPGGNKVILDDKEGQISLADSNSNTAVLSKDGIKLSSPKDIQLDSKGKISLSAVSGISLETSGGDLTGKGLNVSLEAQVSMTAKGNASAEFSASGQAALKGAIVMIN